mmetsp:Transcript_11994/g.39402  ORF Transcript_11994/g.39402 Transcript_11994/m.39402 type:complete len:210 (-) Transcript_11994:259-888(-)
MQQGVHISVPVGLGHEGEGVGVAGDERGLVVLQRRHVGLLNKVHSLPVQPEIAVGLEQCYCLVVRVCGSHHHQGRSGNPAPLADGSERGGVRAQERGSAQRLGRKRHLDPVETQALAQATRHQHKHRRPEQCRAGPLIVAEGVRANAYALALRHADGETLERALVRRRVGQQPPRVSDVRRQTPHAGRVLRVPRVHLQNLRQKPALVLR